jgi:hypothetical protein
LVAICGAIVREEVLATLSEMLVADCEFTENQRREIFDEIIRLHG